jgi:hypothetical protein
MEENFTLSLALEGPSSSDEDNHAAVLLAVTNHGFNGRHAR